MCATLSPAVSSVMSVTFLLSAVTPSWLQGTKLLLVIFYAGCLKLCPFKQFPYSTLPGNANSELRITDE